jgi:nitrite reductase/ring-hydroxylating ferredoxin subunit
MAGDATPADGRADAATPGAALRWERVARLAELEPGLPTGVRLADGTPVCLVREGETVLAVSDRCPHRDFALSGGDLVAPGVLECPWHGARFDCRTGAVLQGPATDGLAVFAVQVAHGHVAVAPLPDPTGAVPAPRQDDR